MLYGYEKITPYTPYYSNVANMPVYKAWEAAKKREQLGAGIAGGVFSAIMSLFPGGAAIGQLVNNGIKSGLDSKYKAEGSYLDNLWKDQLPANVDASNPMNNNQQSNVNMPDFSKMADMLMQMRGGNSPSLSDTANAESLPDAPATGDAVNQPITISPAGGNMDWGWTAGYSKGGMATTDESVIVRGGKGNDDIALVEEDTGKDTGVRVQKGEMLVISKEMLESLNKALDKKDKEAVFSLIKGQVSQKPTIDKGTAGFKDGGMGKTDGFEFSPAFLNDYYSNPKSVIYKNGKWYWKQDDGKGGEVQDTKIQQLLNKEYEKVLGDKVNTQDAKDDWSVLGTSVTGGKQPWETYPKGPQAPTNTGTLDFMDEIMNKWNNLKAVEPPTNTSAQNGMGIKSVSSDKLNSLFAQRTVDQTEPALYGSYKDAFNQAAGYSDSQIGGLQNTNYSDSQLAAQNGYTDSQLAAMQQSAANGNRNANLNYWLPSALGYGMDAVRLGLGLAGANTPLPNWSKPTNWQDYMDQLKLNATIGLTPEERARLNLNADRTYAYDTANIYNLSGGNAGMALGNLGRAANSRYENELNIAAMNNQVKRQNLGMYGSALGNDVNLDRLLFSDVYNKAYATQSAAAQLANDAFTNIKERAITDQFYSPQSMHGKLQQSQLDQNEYYNQLSKAFDEYIRKNGANGLIPSPYNAQ